jgi:hypothetical protein
MGMQLRCPESTQSDFRKDKKTNDRLELSLVLKHVFL